jgi:threonine/homoserine/homoserine lactone efflux protein
MLTYLLAAVSLGLSAGLSPGPLLATVIAQTMKYGFREGAKTACSPLLTDLPIIVAAVWLLAGLAAYRHILGLVAVAGGLFVAYLAWETFRAGPPSAETGARAANSVLKGAAVNLLSPHPYLFWLTVGGPLLLGGYRENPATAAAFLACFYVSLIGAMTLLALAVAKSRRAITGRGYAIVMKILAGGLLILAALLLREGWRLLS